MNASLEEQIDALYDSYHYRHRYLVKHHSPSLSYFNYFDSKIKAYWCAIRPRYWKCATVVLVEILPEEVPEVDFSHVT